MPPPQNNNTVQTTSHTLTREFPRKRWSHKVRTGCSTCRARHLKCDESKPICRNCALGKRTCRGYAYQPSHQLTTQSVSGVCRLQFAPTLQDIGSSPKERQMFHVFCQSTIPHVASMLDQEFWSEDVPRASLAYPAIRHASLAMAAMHLILRIPEDAVSYKKTRYEHYTFALTHYNAALKDIASILSHGVPHQTYRDVFLICSVLFTSIAVLSGATDEIMLHARSALHLFYQWKFWEESDKRRDTQPVALLTNKAAFVRLMSRLEAQIMWRGCIRDWNDPAQVRLPSSRPFRSTMDAYVEMQTLISAMTEFQRLKLQNTSTKYGFTPIQDSYGLHAQAVTTWRAKYRELRRSQKPHEHELIPDFVVRIWLTWFEKALGLCTEKDWCCQIALNPIYKEVLALAEKTADSSTDNVHLQNHILGGFSYGPSVCEPLQMVAIHRESSLSHRAIALLRRLGRNEGLWDTKFMASFAEARTMVEESLDERLTTSEKRPCGFGQLGCTCGRVVEVSIEFLETKAARVRLRALDEALGHSSEHIRNISW